MPLYEYRCLSCDALFQNLIMRRDEEKILVCPKCHSADIKKLISIVAYHVSEKDRLANFNPSAQKDDAFYRDSRNIGLSAKKKAQEMGINLGSGFEDKLDKLRANPASVLKDSE